MAMPAPSVPAHAPSHLQHTRSPRTHPQAPAPVTLPTEDDDLMDIDELDDDDEALEQDEDMGDPDPEEEEIDQLDSDVTEDEDVPLSLSSPSQYRARPASKKAGERVAPHAAVPLARIEDMLDAEGLDGQMSKEAVYLIALATDEFIKRLTLAGQREASREMRSMVTYRDVASAVQDRADFTFLAETIPLPLRLSDALVQRTVRLKELAEPEAITASAAPSAVPSAVPTAMPSPLPHPLTQANTPTPSAHHPSPPLPVISVSTSTRPSRSQRVKGKARQTNGHGHMEASASPAVEAAPVVGSASTPAASRSTPMSTSVPSPAPPSAMPPRRQSLREPKPRRRPDEEEPPVSLRSASNASASVSNGAGATANSGSATPVASVNTASTNASVKSTRGRAPTRKSARTSATRGQDKEKAEAEELQPPPKTRGGKRRGQNGNAAANARDGSDANPNGEYAPVPPAAPAPRVPAGYIDAHEQQLQLQQQGRPASAFTEYEDDASGERERDRERERRTLVNGHRKTSLSALVDNPGRTIYSQHRQPNR